MPRSIFLKYSSHGLFILINFVSLFTVWPLEVVIQCFLHTLMFYCSFRLISLIPYIYNYVSIRSYSTLRLPIYSTFTSFAIRHFNFPFFPILWYLHFLLIFLLLHLLPFFLHFLLLCLNLISISISFLSPYLHLYLYLLMRSVTGTFHYIAVSSYFTVLFCMGSFLRTYGCCTGTS